MVVSSQKRLDWIDLLRGVCVFLVIILHWQEMFIEHIGNNLFSYLLTELNDMLYPLRMELLFFLSGLFVSRGIRKGLYKYYIGKLKNLLYPYFIWGIFLFLFIFIKMIINDDFHNLLSSLLKLVSGFYAPIWFLYFLFIFYIIIPLVREIKPIVMIFLCITLSILFQKYITIYDYPFLFNGDINIYNYFYFFMYFYFGDYFYKNIDFFNKYINKVGILYTSFFSLLSIFFIENFYEISSTSFIYFVPVLLSIPIIIFFFNYLSTIDLNFLNFFKFIGFNSIVFYLLHFYILVLLDFIYNYMALKSEYYAFLSLIICIVVPVLITLIRRKYDFFDWLFFPRLPKFKVKNNI